MRIQDDNKTARARASGLTNQGMTLIELMIAMAVISLGCVAFSSLQTSLDRTDITYQAYRAEAFLNRARQISFARSVCTAVRIEENRITYSSKTDTGCDSEANPEAYSSLEFPQDVSVQIVSPANTVTFAFQGAGGLGMSEPVKLRVVSGTGESKLLTINSVIGQVRLN